MGRLSRVFRRDRDSGATAVEYALMVAFIAIVIIAGVTILGQNVSTLFSEAATRI